MLDAAFTVLSALGSLTSERREMRREEQKTRKPDATRTRMIRGALLSSERTLGRRKLKKKINSGESQDETAVILA